MQHMENPFRDTSTITAAMKENCLPDSGELNVGGYIVNYIVVYGPVHHLHEAGHQNICTPAHSFSHALQLGAAPSQSQHWAEDLLTSAQHESLATPGTYMPPASTTALQGHYILCQLEFTHFRRIDHPVILFIDAEGNAYQHYPSNAMMTGQDVLDTFEDLKHHLGSIGLRVV